MKQKPRTAGRPGLVKSHTMTTPILPRMGGAGKVVIVPCFHASRLSLQCPQMLNFCPIRSNVARSFPLTSPQQKSDARRAER